MEVTPEKVAELQEQLDELSKKAETTDKRIAKVQEDVELVKERADKVQKRLKSAEAPRARRVFDPRRAEAGGHAVWWGIPLSVLTTLKSLST